MSLLVETIRIDNGKLLNIHFHNERMSRTLYYIYGIKIDADLEKTIEVPPEASKGICKCRVLYDDKSVTMEFIPYVIRQIRSLKIIHSDICYPYKYVFRDKINALFDLRGECDDILIVKYGKLTDSSYSNVILKDMEGNWKTPATYLLPGTRRASLLKSGLIEEADIPLSELSGYSELKLINAMIGIEDTEGIPVENIINGL